MVRRFEVREWIGGEGLGVSTQAYQPLKLLVRLYAGLPARLLVRLVPQPGHTTHAAYAHERTHSLHTYTSAVTNPDPSRVTQSGPSTVTQPCPSAATQPWSQCSYTAQHTCTCTPVQSYSPVPSAVTQPDPICTRTPAHSHTPDWDRVVVK